MQENYYVLGKEQLNKLTKKESLLLHCCCAPCSTSVIEYLLNYYNITVLFYNPNIYPRQEYNKRKEELIHYIKPFKNVSFIDCDYDNKTFEQIVTGLENEKEGGRRCEVCIKNRLEKTAITAKENNFNYYCSTLSVSPYKNATLINKLGKYLAKNYNITWLYSDFKKNDGYKRSIELSRINNLYRQNYCGCKYSKR